MSTAKPPEHRRPMEVTPLKEWLQATGKTSHWLSRQCEMSEVNMENITNGRTFPSLVAAFKIERATAGGVPAVSWLGTTEGKYLWINGPRQKGWRKRNALSKEAQTT